MYVYVCMYTIFCLLQTFPTQKGCANDACLSCEGLDGVKSVSSGFDSITAETSSKPVSSQPNGSAVMTANTGNKWSLHRRRSSA